MGKGKSLAHVDIETLVRKDGGLFWFCVKCGLDRRCHTQQLLDVRMGHAVHLHTVELVNVHLEGRVERLEEVSLDGCFESPVQLGGTIQEFKVREKCTRSTFQSAVCFAELLFGLTTLELQIAQSLLEFRRRERVVRREIKEAVFAHGELLELRTEPSRDFPLDRLLGLEHRVGVAA